MLSLMVGPVPLAFAHSHNDYEHARPLQDALDAGFTSVEADIFLVDGKLLVGHNKKDLKPERTLEALYLDPLVARMKVHGGGIYDPGPFYGLPSNEEPDVSNNLRWPLKPAYGPTFQLLIDIKENGSEVYKVLSSTLARYRPMLTSFEGDETKFGMVTIVLSGDRPIAAVRAEKTRLCAIDGRPIDLESNPARNLVPLISENWLSMFKWLGVRGMPDDQRQKLKAFVEKAHAQGRRVRFWGTPDTPEIWRELYAANVDYLGADNLDSLRDFLLAQRPRR